MKGTPNLPASKGAMVRLTPKARPIVEPIRAKALVLVSSFVRSAASATKGVCP